MKVQKKNFWGDLILAALFVLTLYYLLRGDGLRKLAYAVQRANPVYLAAGLMVMIGFVLCEACNTRLVLRPLCGRVPFRQCLNYAFAGFYFSAITPSASGGQPAQMLLMAKDHISVPHSALCYLMIGAVYQVSMLLYAGAALLVRGTLLGTAKGYVLVLFGLGAAFNLLLVGLMALAMFWQSAAEKLVMGTVGLLEKCHMIRQGDAVRANVRKQLDGYRAGAALLRRRPGLIAGMLAVTLLQLTCMYSVPAFVYAALGLSGHSLLDMLALQAVLTVAVSSLPLPGAVGASESVFLQLSAGIFTAAFAQAGVLLSRGISFYAMLLLSGIVVAVFSVRHLDKAREV